MAKRSALFLVLVSATVLAVLACGTFEPREDTPSTASKAPGAPNIVVILADDMGYGDVGFNGPTDARTPNLDRLASEGVVFSNSYVASSLCSPSRARLLTGRHPARLGYELNRNYNPLDLHMGLDTGETLFPELLQQTGYRTALIGKWHLGSAEPFNPLNRGFNYFYGFVHGGHSYYHIDVSHGHRPYMAPLMRNKHTAAFSGYLTDALTDDAVGFVGAGHDAPFFLYLSYNAPHTPLQAPPELVNKYRHIADKDRRVYLAMVDSLDQNVGRLLEALEEQGIRDNTIVFFLSDNGADEDLGDNAPLRGHKNTVREGGIRVPFLASWPARWPQGVVYEPMVSSLDIAVTALSLAGAPFPTEQSLDGVNLDPYLRGESTGPPHDVLYWRPSFGGSVGVVRSGDLKLVAERDQPLQLYDLSTDIGETRNVAAERPKDAARLSTLWNGWNADNPAGVSWQPYESELERRMKELAEQRARWGSLPPYQIEVPEPAPSLRTSQQHGEAGSEQ